MGLKMDYTANLNRSKAILAFHSDSNLVGMNRFSKQLA